MQPDSGAYYLFLAGAAGLFCLWRNSRGSILAALSLLAYAWADPLHLPLMAAMVVLNYLFACRLSRPGHSRAKPRIYWAAVALNVGLLAGAKSLGRWAFTGTAPGTLPEFLLGMTPPLGLSYFTFQVLGCLTDLYRGEAEKRFSLVDFTAFCLFFPQISAGPISRLSMLMPQLQARAGWPAGQLGQGLTLIACGLFKKLVVANNLGLLVDQLFLDYDACRRDQILVAVLLNPVQLFADFSGYTDIARGSACLLGVHLPLNFDAPFKSASVTEFWRRWHMSLSDWLRDYLFTPLMIAFRGLGRPGACLALLLTFALCGVWHGFTWPFLLFGLAHGGLLSVELLTRPWRSRWAARLGPRPFYWAGWAYTMSAFTATELLFRARSTAQIAGLLGALLDPRWQAPALLSPFATKEYYQRLAISLLALGVWPGIRWLAAWATGHRRPVFLGVVTLVIVLLGRNSDRIFIYAGF